MRKRLVLPPTWRANSFKRLSRAGCGQLRTCCGLGPPGGQREAQLCKINDWIWSWSRWGTDREGKAGAWG